MGAGSKDYDASDEYCINNIWNEADDYWNETHVFCDIIKSKENGHYCDYST